MIAPTKRIADFGQTELGKFAGQAHSDLAWAGNDAGALFGKQIHNLDAVEISNSLLDVFHGDLLVLRRQQILERLFSQLDRDRTLVESGISLDAVESAFQFADIGTDVLGDKERNVLTDW